MTEETSNARGEVKVGDRVRATRDGSSYYRNGDCGTVLRIDRDGDFWVRWDNPLVPDPGHGWCIHPHNCALAAPPPAAAEPKTLPVPTHVYLTDKAAVIVGDPQRGWDEEGPEAHNCDNMGCSTIGPHVLARVPFTDERAISQQPEARGGGDGCHCGTCTCNPNMTPAVRFDLSPAQKEGAIRDHLIALGWTPPGAQQPAAEAHGGGEVNMVVTVRDGTWVGTYAEWCRRKQPAPPSAPDYPITATCRVCDCDYRCVPIPAKCGACGADLPPSAPVGVDLPINDAVPAPTETRPGNLFLWNWTAMQQYGRACIAHALSKRPTPKPDAVAGLVEKAYAGCTIWRGSLRVSVTETEAIEYRIDADEAFCDLAQRALDSLAAAWDDAAVAQQPTQQDDGEAASPNVPVGVKTLSEFMAEQEALHPGIHDKVQAATDELRASLAQQPTAVHEPCAAVAAIQFALTDPEGMTFLRLWNDGEFDTLRREWPDALRKVYDGADPLAAQHQEPTT